MPYETPAELAELVTGFIARQDGILSEIELINLKGSVPLVSDLDALTPSPGDAYVVAFDGHLYVFIDDVWQDVGEFKGEKGDTGDTGPVAWAAPVPWATDTAFTAAPPRSVVTHEGATYVCLVGHTSGVFAADLSAGRWRLVAAKGATGDGGWAPVLAVVADGARRVLQVADWTGGEGAKPDAGAYLGDDGLVETAAEAKDIRGATGDTGETGEKGDTGDTGATGPSVFPTFVFSATTTDADPGAGQFRLNNATVASVTQAFIDNASAAGNSVTAFLDGFDDSTNPTTKGYLVLRQVNDPTKELILRVTGTVVDGTGYRKVPVAYVSGVLPTAAAEVGLGFYRSGDKGLDGLGAGDVIGPATNSADYVPQWNGANSKTLNNGRAIGAAASTDLLDRAAGDGRYQPLDADLSAIAALTSAADRMPYFSGAGAAALATFTAFGRSLVDDADAAAARTTLGLSLGTDVQAYNAKLAALAGPTAAADTLFYFTGAATAAATTLTTFGRSLIDDANAAAARTTLGLGAVDNTSDAAKPISAATQAALDLKADAGDVATPADLERSMIRVMLALAELRANQFGTPNGIADDFSDADGVDATASTGEVFDAVAKLFTNNPGDGAAVLMTSASTPSGHTVSASSEFNANYAAWKAFNGDLDVANENGWVASVTGAAWLRRQWTMPQTVSSYTITSGTAVVNTPKTWTLRGSNNGSSWTTLDTQTGVAAFGANEARTYTIASPQPFTYYELNVTDVQTAGSRPGLAELSFSATAAKLDLRSNAFTAIAAPTAANAMVIAKCSASFTLNTDLVAKVSRDNGTTWTTATLVARETAGAYTAYEALGIDLSAQPSGTAMRWRVEGAAGKVWDVTAVVLMWNGGA